MRLVVPVDSDSRSLPYHTYTVITPTAARSYERLGMENVIYVTLEGHCP